MRYHDAQGRTHEQRASIVVLSAYALANVRLMLLSGLGAPYDPLSGHRVWWGGTMRTTSSSARAPSSPGRTFESYVGAGAGGTALGEFNCDNFDHDRSGLPRRRGIWNGSGGAGPLVGAAVPPGTPGWGLEWKRAIREWYDRSATIAAHGLGMPYREHLLDLDPTYTDAWGDPLLRMTFDWGPNEQRMYRFLRARVLELAREMGPDHVAAPRAELGRFDAATYMATHNTGGAIMGADRASSVINPWLQMWDVENVWVVGGSAMPQAPGVGLTGTICALAYRAATGIVERYLSSPGPLA